MTNPRSPESGDVPEVIDLDNAADLITRQCFEIAAAGEPHASYAREMQRVAIAGLDLRRRYNALEAENARLTAELSTARERAARRESDDSARLEFLQDEHDRLDPVVKLVAKRDFDRNSSEWVEIVAVIETLDAARQSTPTGATNE